MTRGHILPAVEDEAPEWELDEPAYTRHPRCIPLLSGTEDEAGSALLEVRYKPRKSAWTRTPPSSVGWWWVARTDEPDAALPVRVQHDEAGHLVWSLNLRTWSPVTVEGVLWSDRAMEEPA